MFIYLLWFRSFVFVNVVKNFRSWKLVNTAVVILVTCAQHVSHVFDDEFVLLPEYGLILQLFGSLYLFISVMKTKKKKKTLLLLIGVKSLI